MSIKKSGRSKFAFSVIILVVTCCAIASLALAGGSLSFGNWAVLGLAAATDSPAAQAEAQTEKNTKTKPAGREKDLPPLGGAEGKLIFSLSYPETNLNANSVIFAKDPVLAAAATELSGIRDLDPAWSPDGSKIAFISRRGSTAGVGYPQRDREVYVMNRDGSSQQRLTGNSMSEADPSFSPDGTKIIYVGELSQDSLDFGIYSRNIDGPNQTPMLLIDETSECFSFRSAAGKKSRRKNPAKDAAGRMFYPGYLEFETPNYRPNAAPGSEKIVFGYGGIVYTMHPDGSGCAVLYDETMNFAAEPRYSPDGTKIALVDYFEDDDTYYYYLKIINADTGALINTLFPNDFNSNPVWSPDGSKIAFYAGQNFDYDGGLRIEMVDVDGQNQTPIFTPAAIPRYSGLSWGVPSTAAPPLTVRINSPHPVPGGDATEGVLTIDAPAPAGGATVNLTCLCAVGAMTIPSSVTIPEGETQAAFPIATAVSTSATATTQDIQAERNFNYARASVTIRPSRADLRAVSFTAPAAITAGQPFSVSWAVENLGPLATAGGYTDQIVFSTDEVVDLNDFGFGATNQAVLEAGAPPRVTTKDVTLTGSAVPQAGNYYLIFVTNRNELVSENGKIANNTIVRPVQIIMPDLVAENIVAPAEVEPRVNYTVEWTVRNAGTTATPVGFNNYLYFSLDGVAGNADDLFIVSRSTAALAAGASVVQNATVNIGTTPVRPTGAAFFYVKADGANVVGEGSPNSPGETNNTAFKQVQFFYRVPDLQITAVSAPPEVETDTQFSIGWTTANTGSKDAAAFTERVYYSPDNIINSNDVLLGTFPLAGGLAAGQSVNRIQNVTIPTGTIQTGNYFLYVRTDTASNVDEGANENNNTYFQPTRVRRFIRPDLTVANVTAPPTVFFDQTVQVQWTVTNTGQGATNTPQWKDTLYLGTNPTSTSGATKLTDATSITALNPGESYTASATVKIPRGINGAYYFHVRTNSNTAVNEESTANNLRSSAVQISVPPLPDLLVPTVNAPDEVFAGAPIDINYTVRNQGTAASGGGGVDRIYLSRDTMLNTGQDRLIFTSDTYYTNIGANTTVSRRSSHKFLACTNIETIKNLVPAPCTEEERLATLPSDLQGLYYVFVVTDIYDSIYEYTNENNNSNYDRVEPGAPINVLITPPDLIVPNEVGAPANAASGQVIPVAFTVKNQGAFNAAPNLYHAVYLSTDQTFDAATDTRLGTVKDAEIFAPAAEHPFTMNVGLPYCLANGTYYLFAVADYDKRQFEFDPGYDAEANNASPAKQIQLTTVQPDLQVTNLHVPPVSEPGQSVAVGWTVTNAGGAATGGWTDRIVLHSTTPGVNAVQLAAVERTGGLAAGAVYTQTRSVYLPAYMQGEYFVAVTTDHRNTVPECGAAEENNAANSANFSVQNNLPDLVIEAVGAPATAVVGDAFNVQWTGRNANRAMPANAPKWTDRVYLSSDTNLSNGDILLGGSLNELILANGQSYPNQAQVQTGNVAAGTYHLLVVADSGNHIYEGASSSPPETNNVRASAAITLSAPAVDLQVGTVSATAPFYSGTFMNISWTVTNVGTTATLGASWSDYVILSRDQVYDSTDTVLGYRPRTVALDGGANYTAAGEFLIPGGLTGEYSIFVITDRTDKIIESNNANNTSQPFMMNLTLPPPSDLNITAVTPPPTVNPGASATFAWTVQNSGANPVNGKWRDTVYLSRDTFWDATDTLVGIRELDSQTTPVAANGGTYSTSVTGALPPVEEGTYYVIVRTDAQNRLRESNEANNLSTAAAVTTVTITELQINTPLATTLANGEQKFLKFTPPPLETLILSLMTDLPQRSNELLTNFGTIVSRADYDLQGSRPGEGNQENVIPQTGQGSYYSLVRHDLIPESFAANFEKNPAKNSTVNSGVQQSVVPQNITVKAEILPFSIRKVSPNAAGNEGYTTLVVEGAKFQTGATVRLVGANDQVLTPIQTRVAPAKIAAMFNLKEKALGDYDVVVTNPDNTTTTLTDGFAIIAGGGHSLRPNILGPSSLNVFSGRVRYTFSASNDGLNDAMWVPILIELPGMYNYELDTSNYVDIPDGYLPPNAVAAEIPFHYDINGRRVVFLMAPILRSRGSVEINMDVLVPASSADFEISVTVLPPLAELLLSNGEVPPNTTGTRRATPGGSFAESDCWSEFVRALAFFLLGELLGKYDKIKDCMQAVAASATYVADLISGVALGEMTGNKLSDSGVYSKAAGKILQLITSVAECNGEILVNAVPLLKALSIAYNIAELTLTLIDCLDKRKLRKLVGRRGSMDPNEKLGPDGFGAERFVPVRQPLLYRINFENLSTATAPAQRIFVSDELPPTLDPRTVRLKEIGFKQNRYVVPDNQAFYQTRVQLGADLNNLKADITAGLDIVNRRITWTLQAIDPATGEQPLDPLLGLLPPNNDNRDGDGYLTFTIEPTATLPTRTAISNQATIIFDQNEPIVTNATANLLDSGIPTSALAALPATSDTTAITLNVSGADEADGSGLSGFDIYYAEDEKPYLPLIVGTTAPSVTFEGKWGKSYRFYSVARDNAGNAELPPAVPDASVTILGGETEGDVAPRPNGNDGAVSVGDVTQIRRFAAGLDTDFLYNEFQRADVAPLESFGNGALSTADVVQARRFATGIDQPGEAAGPNEASSASAKTMPGMTTPLGGARELRPVRVNRVGNKVIVGIDLAAQGDEVGVGFTLNFNPSVISSPSNVALGSGAAGAALTVNAGQAAAGRLGIIVDRAPTDPFPAGVRQLVTIEFDVAPGNPASAVLNFGNTPVLSEIVDGSANTLPASFTSGTLSLVIEPTAANVSVSGRVQSSAGNVLARAVVVLTDQNGNSRTAATNTFGNFRFDNVPTGRIYTVFVNAKAHEFSPQAISVTDHVSDMLLVASPR